MLKINLVLLDRFLLIVPPPFLLLELIIIDIIHVKSLSTSVPDAISL
jgi:hypothetical protein